MRDCAALLHKAGLKTVLVTNGYVCEKPLRELLPLIDAMNIDLKGFTQDYYEWLGGDLKTVKQTIALSAAQCHVEVTTLIVPGKNDAEAEMEAEAAWLASVSPEIPLHISRFFPRYRFADGNPDTGRHGLPAVRYCAEASEICLFRKLLTDRFGFP